MSIYTPRGLKIRLSTNYAFALIARLYPKVSAFKVLKTTEGIESLPTVISLLSGLYCLLTITEPTKAGIITFFAYLVTALINFRGFYFIPGLVALGTFYSYIPGFGILHILFSIAGFYIIGWQFVVAFFIATFLGWCVVQIMEFIDTKRVFRLAGHPFTASERFFFNAYRLHASRIGVTTDIGVSEKETEEENWRDAYLDLADKWPEVVNRFSQE
jgi:hypothetical protein